MLVDWFTVGSQVINFIILVWLLKRFLYKPILDAVDAREKRVAAELADAGTKRAEAEKERDEFRRRKEEFDQRHDELMCKARDEAKAEGQKLLLEARQAADALSAKRQETLRSDARNLSESISRRTREEVFSIARKALADLAATTLEERMVEVFTRRLAEMDGTEKVRLADSLKSATEPAVVRSAFDLPAEQRAKIQSALNEAFARKVSLRFETEPKVVSGVELIANGQKVAWSIADYLASMEKGVEELLKEKDQPEARPDSNAERPSGDKANSGRDTKADSKPKAEAAPT